jgi:hypothetical protein
MSKRRKNRVRPHHHTSGQGNSRGPTVTAWAGVAPPPPHGVEEVPISVCSALNDAPAPPDEEDERAAESGYNRSRHNSTSHGMRSEKCFPPSMAALIEERTAALTAENHPRSTFETWALGELSRAMVQVEVGAKRLLEDEARVVDWVSGPGWQSDASAAAERLTSRIGAHPYRIARELERSKQGTNVLIYHLEGLADAVRSKNGLNDIQRGLLFDVLGVPLPLRDSTRRVPAASDGPALLTLIEQEIARHRANLTSTLDQRDRDAQLLAINNPHSYLDKHRRLLRSDQARVQKQLVWAKEAWDQLRKGVDPGSIIDPRTRQPINPDAEDPPARKRAAAAAPPPPPSSPSSPPPSSGEAAEEATATEDVTMPPFPEWFSAEDREAAMIYAEHLRPMRAAAVARMKAEADAKAKADAAQAEPPPPV